MSKKSSGGSASHEPTKSAGISPLLIGGIVLIAVAVMVMGYAVLNLNRGAGGTPQIRVSAERLELGKQMYGRPVRASFTVTNAGDGPLTLQVPRTATLLEGC